MNLASVILDIQTQALDAPYTYVVPDDLSDVSVGCAVLVEFGHRRAAGFVVKLWEDEEFESDVNVSKLKPLLRVVSSPYFDEQGVACAQWIAERYIAPLSASIRLFTPPGGVPRMVRTARGYWQLEEPTVGEVDDRWVVPGENFNSFEPRKNAIKQTAVVAALQSGELRMAELTTEFGSVSATIKSLVDKGVVKVEHRRRLRGVPQQREHHGNFTPLKKHSLNTDQMRAFEAIQAACSKGNGEVVLVDGVTGSGKTEVYLQAIEAVLKAGRNACVLVPEISLTPQTVARFRGRFGSVVAVMHSRMSQGERYDQWDFIRSGQARVVVGARSALFTPLRNIGLIVIDEEHESSYKQDSAPRYHARDVAEFITQQHNAALVLGSATPSVEALYACAKNPKWTQVQLPTRANGKPLPEITVIDMAKEFNSGSRSMFSAKLKRALGDELRAGHKAVLLLNQRGFAKFLLCRDCGFVPECLSCSTSLTYHEQGGMLVCHHCGHKEPAPRLCPKCGSPYLKKFGAGTQRVEAELRGLLNQEPGVGEAVPIIRMDADTTSKKGAHQRLLEEFGNAQAAVLLGTQMIAKGLDFEDVTLVGVINADTQLNLPDYRAAERTFDLIEQVAGRAGRANLPGRVMVQTYAADAYAIQAAASYNRAQFLRAELPKRKLLGYPPYVRMANILLWGEDEAEVQTEARAVYGALKQVVFDQAGDSWQVLPPCPCVLERLRGNYRYHLVIKAPLSSDFAPVLTPYFRTRKPHKQVNLAIDIDPNDLL